jgi:hypothetical protein
VRTRLLLTTAFSTLSILTTSIPLSAATDSSLSGKSASQVIALAKADSVAKKYVQITVTATVASSKLTEVVALGPSFGTEVLTFPAASASGTVENINGALYVKGNAGFLEVQLNASKTLGAKWANKWISIPSSNSNYSNLIAGLTMSTGMSSLFPTSKLSIDKTTTWHGKSCVEIKGVSQGSQGSLYVSASSPHLVLGVTQVAASSSLMPAKYGVAFSVSTPTGVTPISATGI